jgi:sugar diacid utilization regulator
VTEQHGVAAPPRETGVIPALRSQLSNLQALLVLSMRMTESGDEEQILRLASGSGFSLTQCRLLALHLNDGDWKVPGGDLVAVAERSGDGSDTPLEPGLGPDEPAALEAQLVVLGPAGGPLAMSGEPWAWGFPLRSLEGNFGFLVAAAEQRPTRAGEFLLRVLAQQTGIALANARLHVRERRISGELRSANTALAATVAGLRRSTAIHDRLNRAAFAGEGPQGIADALHELTGYPVAIEDRHGNLRAWAGPHRPSPYPKPTPGQQQQLLRRAMAEAAPLRESGRLIALARPRDDVVGVLVLLDPDGTADEVALVALEHGATVLAMELSRLQSLAETELRVRRDLVEDLLAGTDQTAALSRAQALGYDLERPHRVVVLERRGPHGGNAGPLGERHQDRQSGERDLFDAVQRAAREEGVGTLLVARGAAVVLLSDTDRPWERFRATVRRELHDGRCRLGVGGLCDEPNELPRSFREAQIALRMLDAGPDADAAVAFDDLGVHRLLAYVEDPAPVDGFIETWLGALLSYDRSKGSELVLTLTRYLEFGGNYAATAQNLAVHRSTLKYRLQRIREISGHELTEPDIRFNLELATRARRTMRALREQE